MKQDELNAIRDRVEAASKRPWTTEDVTTLVLQDHESFYWEHCPHDCPDGECEGHFEERAYLINGIGHVPKDGDDGWYFNKGDAEFIAHSPTDMRNLLNYVKELEAYRDRLEEALEQGVDRPQEEYLARHPQD